MKIFRVEAEVKRYEVGSNTITRREGEEGVEGAGRCRARRNQHQRKSEFLILNSVTKIFKLVYDIIAAAALVH